ncbi:MAG: 16S rRNA (cytidine(1402)-2'-O)-methyltransferase [bacterium]|nr:16S rRNA (cytidine(1402)-2'-O)-methyltransferase [bacterium]
MAALLSIIGTPIGNLEDVTLRALRMLRACDVVFCEDTRVTAKLLARHEIAGKPLHRLDAHAGPAALQRVLDALADDLHVCYATDAGTPGISDPGSHLIAAVTAAMPEVRIEPIPGSSAITALASVSGLPTDRFCFLGFLPVKKGRAAALERIAQAEETIMFYESPHRIMKTLAALAPLLGERRIVVGRELTKKFETVYRGTVPEVIRQIEQGSAKGEYVIAVEGVRDGCYHREEHSNT